MLQSFIKTILIGVLSLSLFACIVNNKLHPVPLTSGDASELQKGKQLFEDGYYKKAMHRLLPLACDGNAEAQYAVGYMYYYGFGVAQDTDVGYFWISRSAEKGYPPAVKALTMITQTPGNVQKH